MLCPCSYWIIFKNCIHKSICILSIIAHCLLFMLWIFFLLKAWEIPKLKLYSHLPNWINPLRSTCWYKWASSTHSGRESITFPTHPTSPQKLFFFTLGEESHLQHWSGPPLACPSFQEGPIGWSGSSHTPFLEALKPWDSSTFELVIEAGQDRGLDRVSRLTYLGLRFFICKIKCMIQVISSIPFSSALLWILFS